MTKYENVKTVLLVEDNPDEVFLMRRVFKQARINARLLVATDGKQAVSYLEGTDPYHDRQLYPLPDLVFLDLKLPFLNGFVVLAWIRRQIYLNDRHFVILTSSMEDQDREKAAALGALFLIKPPTPQILLEAIRSLGLCGEAFVEK